MKPLLKKIIASFLLLSFITFSSKPVYATEVPTSDALARVKLIITSIKSGIQTKTGIKTLIKDFVLDVVAYTVAQRVAERLTNRILAWANGGFKDGAKYFKPTKEEYKSIATAEYEIALASIRNSPFARSVARDIALTKSIYGDGLTLEEILGGNWQNVYTNFNEGGWGAYSALINPQNNPIGLLLSTQWQATANIQARQGQFNVEFMSSNGFVTVQECLQTDPPGLERQWNQGDQKYQPPATLTPEQEKFNRENPNAIQYVPVTQPEQPIRCVNLQTVTPGRAVASQVEYALNEPLARSKIPTEFKQLLSSTLSTLVQGLTDAGLRKLSGTVNPGLQRVTDPGKNARLNLNTTQTQDNSVNWINSPFLEVNLEKELYGDEILAHVDDDNDPSTPSENDDADPASTDIPVPSGVMRKGKIALANEEIALLEQMQNELSKMPNILMQLDHCLPGPDGPGDKWAERLRDAVEKKKAYGRVQKQAGKDKDDSDAAQDMLTQVSIQIAQARQAVYRLTRDPKYTIPSYQTILNQINQVDNISSTLEYTNQRLQDANDVRGTLVSIASQYFTNPDPNTPGPRNYNANLTEDEEAQLLYQYSQTALPSEEAVITAQGELDDIKSNLQRSEDLLVTCKDEVQQRLAEQPDPNVTYNLTNWAGYDFSGLNLILNSLSGGTNTVINNTISQSGRVYNFKDFYWDSTSQFNYQVISRNQYPITLEPLGCVANSLWNSWAIAASLTLKNPGTNRDANLGISCEDYYVSDLRDYMNVY